MGLRYLPLPFGRALFFVVAGWPMPVALLPAAATALTAPATAPTTTSRTTFFAWLIKPADEPFLLVVLLVVVLAPFLALFFALFLATVEDPDFLAAAFLLAFFDGNAFLLSYERNTY